MKLFAFDRGRTVDVDPPEERRAVPLGWVRHLAHETDHEVWAIGDQRLTEEAGIPGVAKALERHPDRAGGRPAMTYPREERLHLVGELFPDAEARIVVDDADLGGLEGWTHYYPWEFATAVELGEVGVSVPRETGTAKPSDGRSTDGRSSGVFGRLRAWLPDRF